MTEFILTNKNINTIDKDTFSSVLDKSLITEINIDYNRIHTITNNVFLEFINLKILILTNNNLTTIDNVIFPESLERLNLSANTLTTIDNVKFPKSLEVLFLINNKLTTIDNVKFPESLKVLNLRHNNLTTIDNVKFPESLKGLILHYNNLTTIDNVKFPESLNLLYLSSNNLTTIDNVKFPKSLKELCLSCNKLTNIDNVKFPEGLKELNLFDNNIQVINKDLFNHVIDLDDLTLPYQYKYFLIFSSTSNKLDKYRIYEPIIFLTTSKDDECTVCFEFKELLIMPCKHELCKVCLDNINHCINTRNKTINCPYCRQQINL